MLELILSMILLLVVVGLAVLSSTFKKEMKRKSKYKDFLDDAVDGVENNFSSNNNYAYTSTKGISFYRNKNKEIEVISQSKLCGIAIAK